MTLPSTTSRRPSSWSSRPLEGLLPVGEGPSGNDDEKVRSSSPSKFIDPQIQVPLGGAGQVFEHLLHDRYLLLKSSSFGISMHDLIDGSGEKLVVIDDLGREVGLFIYIIDHR